MILYFFVIIIMTLIASFAGFFIKKSTNGNTIISIFISRYLYIGGLLYIIAVLLNVWLLKRLPYSIVVPSGSFCYLWILLISKVFLKEKINIGKIIGVIIIFIGIICIVK